MMKFIILLWFVVSSGAVASLEQPQFLKDFLDSVHRERSIPTLLLMQRKHSVDRFQQLYPLAWPTIRLDETQSIQLVNFHSRQTLALVYMDSPEDSSLLSALAANFNHMRTARIVIWLQVRATTKLLEIITRQAAEHKFLSVLIIEKAERFLRLYPFPQPSFQVLEKPFMEKKIFPKLWLNFKGKKALTLPDLVPPRSYVHTDQRTGRQRYSGYMYHLLRTFAHTYNITLQLQRPLRGNESVPLWQILNGTARGEIDLPMTGQLMNFIDPELSRINCFLGMTALTIVVPCGKELSVEERLYLVYGIGSPLTFLTSYILLSAVEAIFRRLYNIIQRNSNRVHLLGVVLNLRILRCLLAMSIPRGNRYRSAKGLLIMVMTLSGLINSTITNARYSTVMTMFPQYNHIRNFQQLRESNLTVVFNFLNLWKIREKMDQEFFAKMLPNVMVVHSAEQIRMIATLNTSYAYQIYSYPKDPFSMLQKRSSRKALCSSSQLDIVSGLSYGAVLQQNSVYALALRDFASYIWDVGLNLHWVTTSIWEYFSPNQLPPETGGTPLQLRDFKIIFYLLFIGYALGSCALMAEVFLGRRRINNQA
ncbi:uncharacterized protein Ir47a [Drosophila kikkawai]|uniref:Uncharacterized protein Ir47a n=1 Tax=Drosophila kikkawai TaxID=30033 RepID=A0A6P4J838_DROKI|nr:uncharacterized protein LOC108085076 [Drosophila kikkawai]